VGNKVVIPLSLDIMAANDHCSWAVPSDLHHYEP